MSPAKSPIDLVAFDVSVVRVAQLPEDDRPAAIKREAAALGITVSAWRTRRSKRKHAAKLARRANLSAPLSPSPDGPSLLERARTAAAGGPPTGDDTEEGGAETLPNGKIGTPADELSPDFVVAASVFLVERIGRIFGAIYKLPPAAVIAVSKVSEDERQQLRDSAPLAMPWIRKQLAMADDTAGLYLYLFALVSIGWSKVDSLGTLRAMKAAQDRPHRWTEEPKSGPPSPATEPSEILRPPPEPLE